MNLNAKRRYLGQTMQAHGEWARDNVPGLRFRPVDEVARIVRVARNDVKWHTRALELLTPSLSFLVAWRVAFELCPGLHESWYTGVATAAGFLCSIAARHAALAIFRRRIAGVAELVHSPVSHA